MSRRVSDWLQRPGPAWTIAIVVGLALIGGVSLLTIMLFGE